jgi:hypothetical protein
MPDALREGLSRWSARLGVVLVYAACVLLVVCVVGIVVLSAMATRAVTYTGVVRAIQVEPGLLHDAVVLTFEDGAVVRASAAHGTALPGVGHRAEILGSGRVRRAGSEAGR